MEIDSNKSAFAEHKKAIIATMLLIVFGIGLFNKNLISGLFKKDSAGIKLAEIKSFKNKVRKKNTNSLNWKSVANSEDIHRGDSVSTGQESSALVRFDNGQSLTLDQNTLIVFDQQADTPEFVTGNIQISVNGSMKLKIDNEIVTITGNKSQIQVYKDKSTNKQKIVLLKSEGESKIVSKKNTITLEKNKIVEAKEATLKPQEFAALKADEAEQARAIAAAANPDPGVTNIGSLELTAPGEPEPPAVYKYKLYDFYKRIHPAGADLTLNQDFQPVPNGQFELFTPSNFSFTPVIELQEAKSTIVDIKIEDTIKPIGYVVELSTAPAFSEDQTKYFWARSQFQQAFENAGTYFLRYRKVLAGQTLSDYSVTETLTIIPKKIPVKLAEKPKIIRKVKKAPVEAVIVEKMPEPVIQIAPKEVRAPAAIQEAQSVTTITPESSIRNHRFNESRISANLSQGFLASNKQFENGNSYPQSYNLGFDILYWKYNHGVEAAITKTAVTPSNSLMLAELNYMYRVLVASNFADSNRMQFTAIAGYEMYQNSNPTTDFVSSYSLFKMGLGASLPLFKFWNAEGDITYGMGTAKATSLQFGARLSYYLRPNLSIGVGFKARKYDYVLLDLKNSQSFSETYTNLRYHY